MPLILFSGFLFLNRVPCTRTLKGVSHFHLFMVLFESDTG
jgi:hypothetical protein